MTTAHHHSHGVAGHVSHGGHDHHARREIANGRLVATLVLVLVYMLAEVVGGLASGSLALLADAGHMLSDAGALGLSLFAGWIARRPPTPQRSYGYYRAEILAALVNGATLGAISLVIIVEAYHRLREPTEVAGLLMLGVAVGGLVVNALGLWLLHPGRSSNINVRGAWLHVLSDLLGSVAAILGGIAIWAFGWYWADPIASAAIAILIVYSSWGLLKEAIAILMEGTPGHVNLDEVREAISSVDGVRAVHDLHIWTITSGMESLSGHVVVDDGRGSSGLLVELATLLRERFGIDHVTIQVEPPDFDQCHQAC